MGLYGKVKKAARGAERNVGRAARAATNPVGAVRRDVSTMVHSTRNNFRTLDRAVFGGRGLRQNVVDLRKELKRGKGR